MACPLLRKGGHNKCAKTKPKLKPTVIFKNCSYVCAYHCAQPSYTTQHRTNVIIISLIVQTIVIAWMDDVYWRGGVKSTGVLPVVLARVPRCSTACAGRCGTTSSCRVT